MISPPVIVINPIVISPSNNSVNKIYGMGDVVAKVAQPIASIIDKVVGTNIKECGECKKRREMLNKVLS